MIPLEDIDGLKIETSTGNRWLLKIRKGSKWLNALLYGDEANDRNVFMPKVWVDYGITKNSATSTVINLPSFIKPQDVMSVSIMINLGANHLHCWSWDTPGGTTWGETPSYLSINNRCEVSYQAASNKVHLLNVGTSARSKEYRLSVFFK